LVKVDQLGGFRNREEGSFLYGLGLAHESEHSAVVIDVGVTVEQPHASDARDSAMIASITSGRRASSSWQYIRREIGS